MTFINLTPHALNIHTPDGVVNLAPSGEVARVSSSSEVAGFLGDIPLFRTTLGEVTGLPAPEEGVALIVSGMVAAASPRKDVFSPGDLVRDDGGRPVGCKGLRCSL